MTQSFEDLTAGKTYEFQVYAVNNFGKGPKGVKKFTIPKGGALENWVIPIAAGSGALLFVLAVVIALVVILVVRRRRRNVHKEYMRSIEHGSEMDKRRYIDPTNYGDLMQLLSTFSSEIDRRKIKLEGVVGQGEFADVYKGTLKAQGGKDVVAVKVLRPGSSEKDQRDLLSEASILAQFDHPNVIRLIGVVTQTTPMMIITEFLESGSLDTFLKERSGLLTSLQLVGMGRGVACGMVYLSEMNVIHRDLAARNILVNDNMFCKVADFGLSRELADGNPSSEYETQGGKIAVRWTAPEALRNRTFSSASDVWSYGILLWEIMSFSDRPYWEWTNADVISRVTNAGYRLPPPKDCPTIIYNLMKDCWASDRNNRPKFADIVCRLNDIIRNPDTLSCDSSSQSRNMSMSKKVTGFESVKEWLISINMETYLELFKAANIDSLEKLAKLEEKELRDMGVKLIGHRNKLKKSIKSTRVQFQNPTLDEATE